MKSSARLANGDHQKTFAKIFDRMCSSSHSRWEVWSDFVVMAAIEISNAVDKSNAPRRSETYKTLASKYSNAEHEAFAEMLGEIIMGIEENTNQDFLGHLYMILELGNNKAGQFFTPYNVCTMMSQITESNIKTRVEQEHWISVNDPACGAGATLIAFANECLRQGVNYQTDVLFVAQAIDYVTGLMCYLQLSLLGCAGYVVIANTLTNPTTCYDSKGLIPKHGENVWYTPMYFRDVWHWRRIYAQMDMLFQPQEGMKKSAAMPTSKPAQVDAEEPVIKETAKPQIQTLNVGENGQLTLF